MSVFGLIVAGRMVQTDFKALKENEFVIELANADCINHICVFLTGVQPLPDGFGASIYISWPNSESAAQWHYLSFISNDKPSALFKIGQLKKNSQQNSRAIFGSVNMNDPTAQNAILGILLEPLDQIRQKTEPERTQPAQQVAQFAEKMLNNFINFVQSFAVSFPKPGNMSGQFEEYVPARTVTEWYSNFQRKLQLDPDFWKNLP